MEGNGPPPARCGPLRSSGAVFLQSVSVGVRPRHPPTSFGQLYPTAVYFYGGRRAPMAGWSAENRWVRPPAAAVRAIARRWAGQFTCRFRRCVPQTPPCEVWPIIPRRCIVLWGPTGQLGHLERRPTLACFGQHRHPAAGAAAGPTPPRRPNLWYQNPRRAPPRLLPTQLYTTALILLALLAVFAGHQPKNPSHRCRPGPAAPRAAPAHTQLQPLWAQQTRHPS